MNRLTHKIICADSTEIMKNMEYKSIDLIVTDPPYGVGIEYDIYSDTFENWKELTDKWLKFALKVAKTVIFTPGGFEQEKYLMQTTTPKWRLCWYKGAQRQRSPVGFKHFELLYVYGSIHSQCPDYFFAIPEIRNKTIHPVPKPYNFYKWIITNFSNNRDIVCDPFCGSGVGLAVAEDIRRNSIGIDISKKYCQLSYERLLNKVKQTKLDRLPSIIEKVGF